MTAMAVVGFCGAGYVVEVAGLAVPCTRTLEDFISLERGLDTASIELTATPPSLFADRKSRPWLAEQLHKYLSEVAQHPRASLHTALAHFLNAASDVQLVKSEGLGLALEEEEEAAEFRVVVDGFAPIDTAGRPGPAEASGRVRVGDAIVAVSGQSMRGLAYDTVLDCIRQAPDPVCISFAPAQSNSAVSCPSNDEHMHLAFDGQLSITAVCASGLREVQAHQNPYVAATMVGTHEQRRTQCVYGGGAAPAWNTMHDHEMKFGLDQILGLGCPAVPAVAVTLEIFNRNMARDELVGTAAAQCSAVPLPNGIAAALPADVRTTCVRHLGVDTGGSVEVKITLRGKVSAATPPHPAPISSTAPTATYTIPLVKSEGLGLALEEEEEAAEFRVVVDGFAPIDTAGRPGPAEASGRVRVGDAIVAVSGQSMRGLAYDTVLDCIRQAPDPVCISFASASNDGNATDLVAAASAASPPLPPDSDTGSGSIGGAPNLVNQDAFEAEKQAIELRHARARQLAAADAPAPSNTLQDRVTLQVDTSEGLGIMLQEDCADGADYHVLVDEFVALEDGTVGPLEASGLVNLGDVVTAVEGKSMSGLSYDDVLACMSSAPNPITLEFGPSHFAAVAMLSVSDFLAACGLQSHEEGVKRELTSDLGELMEEVLDDFDAVAAKLEHAGLDDVEVSTLLVAITDAIGDDDEEEAATTPQADDAVAQAAADTELAQVQTMEAEPAMAIAQQERCETDKGPDDVATTPMKGATAASPGVFLSPADQYGTLACVLPLAICVKLTPLVWYFFLVY